MNASPTAIAVMCIVIVLCLTTFLTLVMVASRQPSNKHEARVRMPAGVRGGRHVAVGGRSVAPNRDTLALPGQVPRPRTSEQPAAATQPEAAVPGQRQGQEERSTSATGSQAAP
jgi:hypothetical protein